MTQDRQDVLAGKSYWAPLTLLLFVGFNLPIAFMIGWSISKPWPTADHFVELLSSSIYFRIFRNTFGVAAITTLACAALGYPLAYFISKQSTRIQLVLLAAVVLPCWVSILVRTYAWIVVLGNAGIVNRTLIQLDIIEAPIPFLYNVVGVVIGTVNVLLPFLVLPLFSAMRKIDPRLMAAARSLGASERIVFWRVFFPLTVPALLAGSILIFILTLGFFVTPAILGGGKVMMVSNMMDLLINELPQWELAAAASVALLVFTLALHAISRRLDRIRFQ